MGERTCAIEGCPGKHKGHGYCNKHLLRWKTHGDPLVEVPPGRHTLDPAAAVQLMRDAGLEPLAEYVDTKTPWRCRCMTCGAEVYPRYSNVKQGMGCIRCGERRRGLKRRRENNPLWKGDDVAYRTVHRRLEMWQGRASEHSCADCGAQADDWSYDGGSDKERVEPASGLAYSPDLGAYVPRCRVCHKRRDNEVRHAP
jgi:DNA-directed RNA polymerase subunit RPC12/RpoP